MKDHIRDMALKHLGLIAYLERVKEADQHTIRNLVKAGLTMLLETGTADLKAAKDEHPHLEKVEVARLYRLAEDELKVLNGGAGPQEEQAEESPYGDVNGPIMAALEVVDARLQDLAQAINAHADELEDHRDLFKMIGKALEDMDVPVPEDGDEAPVDDDACHTGNYL